MSFQSRNFLKGRFFAAFVLIFIGVLLLLPRFGFDWNINFRDFWPLILVCIGISRLFDDKAGHRSTDGLVWIFFGLFFLGRNLGLYHFRFHLIWPLLLIAAGILLLGQHVRRTHTDPDKDDRTGDSDRLHAFWFLGGGTLRVDSKKFRGGDVASFLSGGKIDLRNADFQNEAVVDVLSFLGKIEIIVPDGWEVSIQGTSLLGNMKNKTGEAVTIRPRQKPAESKRLVVKGLAFLGDVEVSNG